MSDNWMIFRWCLVGLWACLIPLQLYAITRVSRQGGSTAGLVAIAWIYAACAILALYGALDPSSGWMSWCLLSAFVMLMGIGVAKTVIWLGRLVRNPVVPQEVSDPKSGGNGGTTA